MQNSMLFEANRGNAVQNSMLFEACDFHISSMSIRGNAVQIFMLSEARIGGMLCDFHRFSIMFIALAMKITYFQGRRVLRQLF